MQGVKCEIEKRWVRPALFMECGIRLLVLLKSRNGPGCYGVRSL